MYNSYSLSMILKSFYKWWIFSHITNLQTTVLQSWVIVFNNTKLLYRVQGTFQLITQRTNQKQTKSNEFEHLFTMRLFIYFFVEVDYTENNKWYMY